MLYEMVVHVDNLDEYRAVLKKWFKKGYDWSDNTDGKQKLHEEYFVREVILEKYLLLDGNNIRMSLGRVIDTTNAVSFKEFMDKERGKVTYEVSEEQLGFLHKARENQYPATYLIWDSEKYKAMFSGYEYTEEFERDLLKYVSGDENVVFQLKDPLYLLKGKDRDGDTVYFTLDGFGAPTYVFDDEKSDAFKASYDEIVRWENPFWKVERVTD